MSMISPEAMKKYVQRRADDLSACKLAVANKDAAVIENIGHKIKGNGLTFGYPELAEIGKDMEAAAVAKDWDLISLKVTTFEEWFNEKKDDFADQPTTQL